MSDQIPTRGPRASAASENEPPTPSRSQDHGQRNQSDDSRATGQSSPSSPTASQFVDKQSRNRSRTSDSMLSRAAGNIKRASSQIIDEAPTGLMASAGAAAATAPTLNEIRRGSFGDDGWSSLQHPRSHTRRSSDKSRSWRMSGTEPITTIKSQSSELEPAIKEVHELESIDHALHTSPSKDTVHQAPNIEVNKSPLPQVDELPKLPWTKTWAIGIKCAAKWVITLKGFLITVYFLNVVAWGGMLFLLLCKAAPAMCPDTPDGCNDFNSARRKWMEIDQQILNVFFCITGFGLAPWRARDTWYLLVFRGIVSRDLNKREMALRRLAGYHRGWFRLRGSEDWKVDEPLRPVEDYNLDPTVPYPIERRLGAPITGVRAPPTSYWKMDFLVWNNLWNTIFQAFLAAFMWAYNRANRPPWTTALFISLAFGCAIAAGVLVFMESSRVKKVEGVLPNPATVAAQRALQLQRSNLADADVEKGTSRSKQAGEVQVARVVAAELPENRDHTRTGRNTSPE